MCREGLHTALPYLRALDLHHSEELAGVVLRSTVTSCSFLAPRHHERNGVRHRKHSPRKVVRPPADAQNAKRRREHGTHGATDRYARARISNHAAPADARTRPASLFFLSLRRSPAALQLHAPATCPHAVPMRRSRSQPHPWRHYRHGGRHYTATPPPVRHHRHTARSAATPSPLPNLKYICAPRACVITRTAGAARPSADHRSHSDRIAPAFLVHRHINPPSVSSFRKPSIIHHPYRMSDAVAFTAAHAVIEAVGAVARVAGLPPVRRATTRRLPPGGRPYPVRP